eukprot:15435755-Alexandrium_andersonii.AAC.1
MPPAYPGQHGSSITCNSGLVYAHVLATTIHRARCSHMRPWPPALQLRDRCRSWLRTSRSGAASDLPAR